MKSKKNISGSSRNPPIAETFISHISNFKQTYQDIYYGRETIAIKTIDGLPGKEIGVKIALCSPNNTLSHFLYSMITRDACMSNYGYVDYSPSGNEVFRKLQDATIVANRFVDNAQPQEMIFLLKPVFTDGRTSAIYIIKILFISSKYYKAQKTTLPHIIMILTEPRLNIGTGSIDDWVIKPTQAEKNFALRKWGRLIQRAKTNYDKAKVLGKTLMHDLWPHVGTPSDAMRVSPLKQYERMVSGKDKGWCENFARIFVCACNALEIPARICGVNETYAVSAELRIQGGSGHTVLEIFDEHLNQWIWMDLMLYSLGAWLGNVGPLTLAEFHLFLNQDQRRKSLKLLIYDLDNKTEKMLPLEKCSKYPRSFSSFFGWNTNLYYKKLDGRKQQFFEEVKALSKQNPPTARISKIAGVTDIDLSKADWPKGEILKLQRTVAGYPADRKAEARILHDGKCLYLRMTEDGDTSKLTRGDQVFGADDWEIFVAAQRGKPYRQIGINANGKYETYKWGEKGIWEGMQVVSKVKTDVWTVFLSIPLDQLTAKEMKSGDKLYVNIIRGRASGNDPLSWSPHFSGSFHEPARLGELVLE